MKSYYELENLKNSWKFVKPLKNSGSFVKLKKDSSKICQNRKIAFDQILNTKNSTSIAV